MKGNRNKKLKTTTEYLISKKVTNDLDIYKMYLKFSIVIVIPHHCVVVVVVV